MTNHCTNNIHLDGDLKHRQEFVDKNKGYEWQDVSKKKEYHDLSFHAQVPIPKKYVDANAKSYKNDDWYHWCSKNWGTKWDCYELELDHNDTYTCYSFDTAWGSPEAWVKKVSRKFPNIKFNVEWAEEGGEGGRYMYHGGDCFFSKAMSKQEWREFMGVGNYEEEW